MARVIAFTVGELRGKLNGNVYSRNGAGAFVRALVIPNQPNSLAQVAARQVIRGISGYWENLGNVERAGWSMFAKSAFNPFKKTNTGQYSGKQAHTSIYTGSINFNAMKRSFTATMIPTGACTPVLTDIATPIPIPVSTVRPNIKSVEDNVYTISIGALQVSGNGEIECSLMFDGCPPTGQTFGPFYDERQVSFGFSFYLSEGKKFEGQRVANQFRYHIGTTGIIDDINSTPLPGNGVKVVTDVAAAIPTYKNYVYNNQWSLFTVAMVGADGTMVKVAEKWVMVNPVI
jgi:hypothetical protein